MKILSLKRNQGDLGAIAKPSYEIIARSENSSEPSTVTVLIDSPDGRKLDAALLEFNTKEITQEEFLEVLTEVVEDNSSVGIARELSAASESIPISARIQLVDGCELRVGDRVIEGPLADQIFKMLEQRKEDKDSVKPQDWLALVSFTELLFDNVNPFIRKQLYSWLSYQIQNGRLTLTSEGKVIGYKGVQQGANGLESIHSGPGIVNGISMNGHLPNHPGNVIEVARDYVDDNPDQTCSTGLHIGSYDYAASFSRGTVVSVEFDPRDVVSVPTDYHGQKIRACKYKVLEVVENQLSDFSISFDEDVDNDFEENEDQISSDYVSEDDSDSSKYTKDDFEVGEDVEVVYNGEVYPLGTISKVTEDGVLVHLPSLERPYRNFKFNNMNEVTWF